VKVRAIHAYAAFFGAIGLTALIVGIHDSAIADASLGVSLESGLMVIAGLVFGVGAYELASLSRKNPPPPCKQRVLIAFLLLIVVGVYIFFSVIGTGGVQRTIVVVFSLALIAVALAGLRYFWHDAGVAFPRIATTVAIGLIGTGIGISEFWYQNGYVPTHLGRAVSLTVSLERVTEQKNFDVVRATIDYEDLGGTGVSVVGSTYTLTGSRLVRCARPATPKAVAGVFLRSLVDPQRSRFMAQVWEIQPASVLAAGKFVGDGKRLDENVPADRELIFYVPRGRYQLLRLRAQLFAIPASIPLSQSTSPTFSNLLGDSDLYGFWRVDDNSWLHDLIYGRGHWIVLRYELAETPHANTASPDLRVTARFPDPTWSKGEPDAAAVRKLFAGPEPSDASEPFADTELALEPIASPTAADKLPATCQS
jgi:hypothetical protein